MHSILESVLIWGFHPFFTFFWITQQRNKDNLQLFHNENGETLQEVSKEAKPFSWFEWIVGNMLFSAFGTGFWVLLHWAILWLAGKHFDLHYFIKGRGAWIDLIPYVLSVGVLLGFALWKPKADRGKNFLVLIGLATFLMSFYVLIVNYLYWYKH